MLIATVNENDEKLDQFDDFCVGYVSEIDHLFSNLPKTICSSTTKRTRAWRVFHHKRGQNLPKLWEDILFSKNGYSRVCTHWCRLGFHCVHPGLSACRNSFQGDLVKLFH